MPVTDPPRWSGQTRSDAVNAWRDPMPPEHVSLLLATLIAYLPIAAGAWMRARRKRREAGSGRAGARG